MGLLILIFGLVAATRLDLAYLPTWTFPELEARLTLDSAGEVEDLTRRYVLPLESAIRTLGQVRGQFGEVSHRGAELRVRFDPGVDAERKAARLESELQSLRRRLPEGASIQIEPIRQGGRGPSTIVWLPGEPGRAPDALVQALENLPEVRAVWVAGRERLEVRLSSPAIFGTGIRRELGRTSGFRSLGRIRDGSRQSRVLVGLSEHEDPMARPVRHGRAALKAGSVADVELRRQDPSFTARVDGRPGQVLMLYREYDASPLLFSRAIDRVLQHHDLRASTKVLVDEAEPLRQILRRSGWGFVIATLLFAGLQALFHGRREALPQLLVLPVALAAAVNAAWIGGISLDVTTLPVLILTLGSALLFQILRGHGVRPWALIWVALAAFSLPVAVILVGGPLGAFLGAPARLFALAAPAACMATLVVPSLPLPMKPWARRSMRFALRRPWALLLGGGSLCYILFVLFGSALAPRPGRLTASTSDISLDLRFADGSTLADAEREVARVEEHLLGIAEVVEQWSVVYPRTATIGLKIREQDRSWIRLQSIAGRLEAQLSHIGASLTAQPMAGYGGAKPIQFDEYLGDRAETDRAITFYRFVLHSTDLQKLRIAYGQMLESLGTSRWRPTAEMVIPDWGKPSPRVELVPLPGVPQEHVDRAVEVLLDRTQPPAAWSSGLLPGTLQEVAVRIVGEDSAEDERHAPHREELFRARIPSDGAGALSPLELFQVRDGLSSPVIKRQGGSFVLPVTVRFLYLAQGQRPQAKTSIAHAVRKARLPAGVAVERPPRPTRWTPERKRLLAIASALPLLLLALTICRLGSVPLGFAALSPAVFSLALITPLASGLRGHLDEMMLLAVIGGAAAVLPLAAEAAAAVRIERATPLAAGRGYRWLTQRLPGALVASIAWLALFGLPAWGLDAERFPWAPGFLIAAAIGPASIMGSFLFMPVLLRSVDLIRFRDPEAVQLKASPPAWQQDAPVSLAVRNVSKVYRNGFQALRGVDFQLQPGIVGLLGPNGAGKTTLLRTLCGLLEPSRGQVLFRGEPVRPENRPLFRRMVGFLPQSFNAYEEITVAAFLDYWALEIGLHETRARREEIERVLHQVGLVDCADKRVRHLSGGMRRRIGIARALLGSPPILIVDEPTTGLDVESRNRLRESLLSVAGERIILFSTHIASDVAATASRILIMNQGRLLFDGSAGALIKEAQGRIFESMVADDQLREFSKLYRVTTRVRTLDGIRVRAVAGAGQEPAGQIVLPNLEEAYLAKLDLAPQGMKARRDGSLLDLKIGLAGK